MINGKLKRFTSIALAGAAFFLFTVASVNAKQITLTLADSTAPVGLRGNGVKILVEEIEKHTNGNVKVKVHWGGSLLKAKEILRGIQDGIVDIGYINSNYYPKQMRAFGAFALFPQGPKKFSNMSWFYAKSFNEIPALKAELDALKIHPIHTNTVLPVSVVSTKPFTKFEDFKGKKIRAASRWWLGQLKGAGAIPVSVPWGDCYMALQTGAIDGVYTNRDGEHRTKLDEVAKNIFTMKEMWIGVPFIYAINADKWNSLPKEIQTQLTAAGKSAAVRFEKLYNDEWAKTEAAQKEMGAIITAASPADIEKWVNMPAIKELKEEWVKEANEAGINGEEVLKQLQGFLHDAMERDNQ